MNTKLIQTVLLLVVIQVANSIICERCEGSSCLDKNQLISERCPPGINKCYILLNEDKVFHRGCASNFCEKMNYPSGSKCATCDADKCNGFRDASAHLPGGGGVWSTDSTSKSTITLTFLTSFVAFLISQ